MTQISIDEYFSRINGVSRSEESSDSDCESTGVEKNVKYYQTLLRKQAQVKENAKIITKTNSLAECWKYFGDLHISNKKVLCKYKFCKVCFEAEVTTLKGFGSTTSTTNLTNHLKACHNIDIKSLTHKKSELLTTKSLTTSCSKSNNFMHARRLCEMCCIDLQPFSTVERPGFQKYIKSLDPAIIFPTSTTVATSALNDVYEFYLKSVKNILQKCPNNITLVTDMWTDKYKKISYMNIKIHFSDKFVLKCVSLKTEHFPHPHTGQLIADKISESLKSFNLENKSIKAVTDGGSNIVSALKIKNIIRYPCMAHSMHRFLVQDILNNSQFDQINQIILKLKQIFKSLTYKGEELQKLQLLRQQENAYDIIINIQNINRNIDADDNFPTGRLETDLESSVKSPHLNSLKNSIETRWNSILNMIESFINNFDVLNLMLLKIKKDHLVISDMEQNLIKEFGAFLEIFSEATTYLQGQEYATVSTCIYFFETIYANLVEKGEKASFGIIIHLYDYAKKQFYKRFRILKIHVLAALMDPCQKNWSKLDVYLSRIPEKESIPDDFVVQFDVEKPTNKEKFILQELKNREIIEIPSCSQVSNEPPVKKEKISETRRKMLEFVSGSGNRPTDSLTKEIQNYLGVDVKEAESLDWWIENQKLYPKIAELANICFSIPATSASSEIAFSSAGSCIAEKRSRLNPSTIKKQLFIHDNYKLVASFQETKNTK